MPSKRVMVAMGMNGQVELLTDRIVIHRHGIMNVIAFGLNSKREILLKSIAEISFKSANFGMGTIEFIRGSGASSSGGSAKDKKKKPMDNIVTFNKKQNEKFEQLKDKIFEMIHDNSNKKAE